MLVIGHEDFETYVKKYKENFSLDGELVLKKKEMPWLIALSSRSENGFKEVYDRFKLLKAYFKSKK